MDAESVPLYESVEVTIWVPDPDVRSSVPSFVRPVDVVSVPSAVLVRL